VIAGDPLMSNITSAARAVVQRAALSSPAAYIPETTITAIDASWSPLASKMRRRSRDLFALAEQDHLQRLYQHFARNICEKNGVHVRRHEARENRSRACVG
jgi:hypothetical protein